MSRLGRPALEKRNTKKLDSQEAGPYKKSLENIEAVIIEQDIGIMAVAYMGSAGL